MVRANIFIHTKDKKEIFFMDSYNWSNLAWIKGLSYKATKNKKLFLNRY